MPSVDRKGPNGERRSISVFSAQSGMLRQKGSRQVARVITRIQSNVMSPPHPPSTSVENTTRPSSRSVCRCCLSIAPGPAPELNAHVHEPSAPLLYIHRQSRLVHASQLQLVHAI